MFKKLIIAVLTLGLLLTFSSAAISSDVNEPVFVRPATNPDAPYYNTPEVSATEAHTYARPLIPKGNVMSLPAPPTNYFCEDTPAFDTAGGLCWFWQLPSAGADGFLYRFPVAEGQACTLKVAWFYLYGPGMVGTPDINVSIYEDNHDEPGTQLFTVMGTYGTDFFNGWNYIDVSGLNIIVTQDYHLEVAINTATSAGEELALVTDCGDLSGGRPSYVVGGVYHLGFGYGPAFTFENCCADIPFSECRDTLYIDAWNSIFSLPHASNCRDGLATRFSIDEGPDTLKYALVGLYDYGVDDGSVVVNVSVYNDVGGVPGGAPLATVTLTTMAEKYPVSGYAYCDFSPFNLVMRDDFHIAVELASANIGARTYLWGYNPGHFPGRSSVHFPASNLYGCAPASSGWFTTFSKFGAWWDFDIIANMCKDEYASCSWKFDYGVPYYILMHRGTGTSIKGFAQKLSTLGLQCRVEKIRFQLDPQEGAPGAYFSLYGDNGGQPGVELYRDTIDPLVDWWPGWTEITLPDIPEAYVEGLFYIGIHGIFHSTLDTFWVDADHADLGYSNAFSHRDPGTGLYWQSLLATYGIPLNLVAEAYTCCVPVTECACAPGGDWPAMGGNFARTGKSGNSIGDAQCKLTKSWEYVAGQVAVFNSPIIYKDTVICYFLDRFAAIDINTGTQIWLRPPDALVIGSAAYSTPTAYNGLVYTAGGAAKAFSALSITTGATVWTRNFTTHSNHFMTFGPSVIVNVGGTDVIIYSDDFGWVYAVNALTGALFPGWAVNPVKLPNAIIRGLTTDGTYLFVGTTIAATSGDIYALDPATGAEVWRLSTSGGLQAATVVPAKDYGGFEGFPNAISVAGTGACEPGADNILYTCSYYPIADNSSPVQQGGVLYSINAADGSLNWAVRAHNGSGGYSMPNIDASRVIHQSWPYWTTSGDHRGPIGVNRTTGSVEWTNTYPTQPYAADFPLMEGVLTCEPSVSDVYIGVYRSNYAKFFNADNGAPLFHRRFTGYLSGSFSNAGHRVAPVMNDSHLLLTWRNKIIGLTNQSNRPRLDIPDYVIDIPVEFGSPSNYVATFPNAIANSGCAPLQIVNITLDEISNNTTPLSAVVSSANQERLTRLSTFVDNFNPKTDNWSLAFADETDLAIDEMAYDKGISMNNAAFAPPPYINSIISPLNGSFVAPGDTIDIQLEVNGPMITRGRHAFYAYVRTNDPDYFLDSALIDDPNYAIPQIELGLIGGCLYATERLYFGTASDNYKIIWNSGFVAHGDSASFDVNGEDAQLWQGALIYAISKYRVALHSLNWHGYDNEWKSLLADPECVLEVCPPHLSSNVLLASMSTDNGATYNNIYGNVMTYSYVDSMQNMDDDTSAVLHWWWAYPWDYNEDPPYDDTLTVGFKACVKAIGVTGVAAFNNFYIERHAVYARYGQQVTDLYLGAMLDYDVEPTNTRQMNGYDASHSLAYVYDCGAPTMGWGFVKIPFGCGFEPLINSKTITAQMGPWNDSDIWLDSVYYWMSNNVGLSHQPGTDPCASDPDDRDAWFTIAKNTFSGSDSGIYCFANFGMPNITDANDATKYYGIADLANKFCGFGRGDVNNDGKINIVDIVYLAAYVNFGGNGPFPFMYLGDVNLDETIDINDVLYLKEFYFNGGPCPLGEWEI